MFQSINALRADFFKFSHIRHKNHKIFLTLNRETMKFQAFTWMHRIYRIKRNIRHSRHPLAGIHKFRFLNGSPANTTRRAGGQRHAGMTFLIKSCPSCLSMFYFPCRLPKARHVLNCYLAFTSAAPAYGRAVSGPLAIKTASAAKTFSPAAQQAARLVRHFRAVFGVWGAMVQKTRLRNSCSLKKANDVRMF